jgi:hypothetical protein
MIVAEEGTCISSHSGHSPGINASCLAFQKRRKAEEVIAMTVGDVDRGEVL